jgi:MraZ protein
MGKNIVITSGLDNCLFVFTMSQWKNISAKLSEANMLRADNRSFNRYMFGSATEVSVDSLGRVLIPDFLTEKAKLKGRVALIGVQDRVEIWNEEAWTNYKLVVEKEADQLAEKLGGAGIL